MERVDYLVIKRMPKTTAAVLTYGVRVVSDVFNR